MTKMISGFRIGILSVCFMFLMPSLAMATTDLQSEVAPSTQVLDQVSEGEPSLLTLSASTISVPLTVGGTHQIGLTAYYSDRSSKDVTDVATWSSKDEAIATVVKGNIEGVKAGTTTVTGSFEGKNANITVIVEAPLLKLEVEPANINLPINKTQTLIVKASYATGYKDVSESAHYEVADPSLVSLDGNVLKGLKPGNTTVTVTYDSQVQVIPVHVMATLNKLEITPDNMGLIVGDTGSVTLTATYNDNDKTTADVTQQAHYTSSDKHIATVDDYGIITAVRKGSTTIKGTYMGKSVSLKVKVTSSPVKTLDVDYDRLILTPGKKQNLKITVIYENNDIENVSSYASIISEDTAVATVSGLSVQAVAPGTTTLTIRYGNAEITIPVVVITPVTQLEADQSSVLLGTDEAASVTLTATHDEDVPEDITALATWKTSNGDVATVVGGEITGVGKGTAVITGTYGGKSCTIDVKVYLPIKDLIIEPDKVALTQGKTVSVKVKAHYIDGKTEDIGKYVDLTSDDETVVSVSGRTVRGVALGTANLTFSYGDKDVTIPVIVTESVTKLEAETDNIGLAKGETGSVKLLATYDDGTIEDVTDYAGFVSNNTRIVTVEDGILTAGNKKGTTTVKGTFGGKSVTVNVRVTSPLEYLDVDTARLVLAQGKNQTLKISAQYEDGSVQNVTQYASIISTNTEVVTVSGTSIKAVKPGTAVLWITYSGKTTLIEVTVIEVVMDVTTDSTKLTLYKEQDLQISLTATYKGGTTADVANLATWKSSDTGVATVDENGLVSGHAKGTTTLTGTFAGRTVRIYVTVKNL